MIEVRATAKLELTSATDALITLYDLLRKEGFTVKLSPEALCLEATLGDLKILFFTSRTDLKASLTALLTSEVGRGYRGCGDLINYLTTLIYRIKPLNLNSVTYVVTYEADVSCSKGIINEVDRYLKGLGAVPLTYPQAYVGSGEVRYEVISVRYGLVLEGLRSSDILLTYTITPTKCELRVSVGGSTRELGGLRRYVYDALSITELIADYLSSKYFR